jgi:hypothetical protein
MKFKVWDEVDGSEEFAAELEAVDAQFAAEMFAEQDADGQFEGIYTKGHPIMVRDEAGRLSRIFVWVEYDPTFWSRVEREQEEKVHA